MHVRTWIKWKLRSERKRWRREKEANEEMRCVRIELRQIRKELMAIKRSVEIIESRMMEGQREERRGENAEDVHG